jgi:Protein of unknown function (DUF3060)
MPISKFRPAFALGVFACGILAAAASAQVSSNAAGFVDSEQTATLDCVGGKAEIMGSNNVLTITGKCSGLELAGSGNRINIQFGPAAKVDFVGSDNVINWTSTDGKPPKLSYVGSGNRLTPSVQ